MNMVNGNIDEFRVSKGPRTWGRREIEHWEAEARADRVCRAVVKVVVWLALFAIGYAAGVAQ